MKTVEIRLAKKSGLFMDMDKVRVLRDSPDCEPIDLADFENVRDRSI